jgi:hypothetical protein
VRAGLKLPLNVWRERGVAKDIHQYERMVQGNTRQNLFYFLELVPVMQLNLTECSPSLYPAGTGGVQT